MNASLNAENMMSYFKYQILKFIGYFTKVGTVFLSLILTFIAPVTYIIIAIFLVVWLDLITAIMAVYKDKGLVAIESNKMRVSLSKMLFYLVLVSVGHFVDSHLLQSIHSVLLHLTDAKTYEWATKITVAGLLGSFAIFIEAYSVDENYQKLTGRSFARFIENAINLFIKRGKNDTK